MSDINPPPARNALAEGRTHMSTPGVDQLWSPAMAGPAMESGLALVRVNYLTLMSDKESHIHIAGP